MNERECETCIKRRTKYCPNSSECYELMNKPYYQNRIMILEENQQLKSQLEQRDDIINKISKHNQQIIEDTKNFYRPTSDTIYSGDCLIDLAETNLKILNIDKGDE